MTRRKRNDSPFTLFAFQDIITAVTGILILITLILALSLATKPLDSSPESRKDIEGLKAQIASLDSDLSRFNEQVESDTELIELMAKYGATDPQQLSDKLRRAVANMDDISQANSDHLVTTQQNLTEASEIADLQKNALEQVLKNIDEDQTKISRIKDQNQVFYRLATSATTNSWFVDLGDKEWLIAPADKEQKPYRFANRDLGVRLAQMEAWYKTIPAHDRFLLLVVRPDGIESYRLVRASAVLNSADFGVDLISGTETVIDPEIGVVSK